MMPDVRSLTMTSLRFARTNEASSNSINIINYIIHYIITAVRIYGYKKIGTLTLGKESMMAEYTVFFSWQSDLPNNKNRSFIESCLSNSIKSLKKDVKCGLEINIDRDTKSKLGTPDIAESIFNKINKCNFFIADVSIINGKSRKYRKTPNPNVLTELGYAAKKLGWEQIICVFNTEFGKVSDLPFDIRNRRILTYELNSENRWEVKKGIEKIFYNALMENHKKSFFSYRLINYYNSDIYSILLTLLIDCSKMIFGYDNNNNSTETIRKILSMKESDIGKALEDSTFVGFQLFKSYDEYIRKLMSQLEKIVLLRNFDDEYYEPLIRLIHSLKIYDKNLNRRVDLSTFNNLQSNNTKFKVLTNSTNKDLPNRLLLTREIDKKRGIVIDFGDFHRKDHIANLTHQFTLTPKSLGFYKHFIVTIIQEINSWIDNNHGDFLIDLSQVEIHENNYGLD